MQRGLLGLVLWLILGFGFTEATVLMLNALMVRGPHPGQAIVSDKVAGLH